MGNAPLAFCFWNSLTLPCSISGTLHPLLATRLQISSGLPERSSPTTYDLLTSSHAFWHREKLVNQHLCFLASITNMRRVSTIAIWCRARIHQISRAKVYDGLHYLSNSFHFPELLTSLLSFALSVVLQGIFLH